MMTANGTTALLDAFTGLGFVVLALPTVAAAIVLPERLAESGTTLASVAASDPGGVTDAATLVDASCELSNWLAAAGAAGVIVRPDFYVHDIFVDAAAANASLAALEATLYPI